LGALSARAKFKVISKTGATVMMEPVYTGSPENEAFWRYTPAGMIRMDIQNPPALDAFVVGAEYYVDFTRAS
jgi:hypothetical protein